MILRDPAYDIIDIENLLLEEGAPTTQNVTGIINASQ